MSEAFYYLLAEYPSATEAEEAAPKVEAFLRRMAEAKDEWQRTRDGGRAAFLKRRGKYRDIYRALGIYGGPEKDQWTREHEASAYSNFEAGRLDSPARDWGEDGGVFVEENRIGFSGEVWHMADWTGLEHALMETFGALDAEWTSDEGSNDAYTALRHRLWKRSVVPLIRQADKALGGTSNDAEHEALVALRDELARVADYKGPAGEGKGDYAPIDDERGG